MHSIAGESQPKKSTKCLSSSSSSSTTLEFIDVSDFHGSSWICAAPTSASDSGAAPASATAGGGFSEALELWTWAALGYIIMGSVVPFKRLKGVPQNGWFIKENPIKVDDDWGYPYFRKPPCGDDSHHSSDITMSGHDLHSDIWAYSMIFTLYLQYIPIILHLTMFKTLSCHEMR